jgi:hypothetical protein
MTVWVYLINAYILYGKGVEVGTPFRPFKICALLSVLLHGETEKYSFITGRN